MDNYMDLQKEHISYALHGKVMLCTGIVLFVALLIILCFHNYARLLLHNRRRRYMRRRAQHLLSISNGTRTGTVASKGLDSSVIKTIPTVIFSTKGRHFPPLECAVCLSEFEKDEKARVLPKCNHTFHVDCIDMWFYSHSNCPLCRAPVQADIPVNPPKILEQSTVVDPVAEAAGSDHPREDIEMNSSFSTAAASSSSSSSSSSSPSSSTSPSKLKMESCPMKTLEVVRMGILVEVPTGEDRLTGMADVGSGNRILNLKRIYSV